MATAAVALGGRSGLKAPARRTASRRRRPLLLLGQAGGESGGDQLGRARVEFIPGKEEKTVPDVRLTRSKDGTNGVATFSFDDPDLFEESQEITGMFLQDEEGELSTTDVKARFVNGQPVGIQARYNMRTPAEWDRFMRFMERYAEEKGLGFKGGGGGES